MGGVEGAAAMGTYYIQTLCANDSETPLEARDCNDLLSGIEAALTHPGTAVTRTNVRGCVDLVFFGTAR
jgi:hypothetical protein